MSTEPRIIVCGAGQVGGQICRYVSYQKAKVTVIERNGELLRNITSRDDVDGVVGSATDPAILRAANVADANLIVAATQSDEANIITCLLARLQKSEATTVARLRSEQFAEAILSRHGGPVDVVIRPEQAVAAAAVRLLKTTSLFEFRSLLEDQALFIGIRIEARSPVRNTPLRQLTEIFPALCAVVVGCRRHGRLTTPDPQDELFVDDEIYLVTAAGNLGRVLQIFGKSSSSCKRLIIVGAGNIGLHVATAFEQQFASSLARVIEINHDLAESAAGALQKTVVLNGDGLDQATLVEAGAEKADAILAVTEDDRTNLLVATQAKQISEKITTMCLVNAPRTAQLASRLPIDIEIVPQSTTVSSILPHIRTGKPMSIYPVGSLATTDGAELIEIEVSSDMPIAGQTVRDAELPDYAIVGAILKPSGISEVTPDTRFEVGDKVAFFVLTQDARAFMRLVDVEGS